MSRRRKRKRRFYDKEKQETRKAEVLECICNAERYGGWHTGQCPCYATNPKVRTPITANSKNSAYYDYGTGKSTSWGAYCDHWRQRVELLEGLHVNASAWTDRPLGNKPWEDVIDIGFYLDDMWTSGRITATSGLILPWTTQLARPKVIHYPWTDYAAPNSVRNLAAAAEWLLVQIASGLEVEVGCIGGHGRTGSVLAALLVAQGMDPWDAVEKVRNEYCENAVESYAQEDAVGKLWSVFHDGQAPRENPLETVFKKSPYTGTAGSTYHTGPILDHCPGCDEAVYELSIHRGKCDGHPTDDELQEIHDKNPPVSALAVVNKNGDGWMSCIYPTCKTSFFAGPGASREGARYCFNHETELKREEARSDGSGNTLSEDEAYREWLRLNAAELEKVRDQFPDEPDEVFHASTLQAWKEQTTLFDEEVDCAAEKFCDAGLGADTHESEVWDAEFWDHDLKDEYVKSAMDEACPYGACMFPYDCEPESGSCFRRMTGGGG